MRLGSPKSGNLLHALQGYTEHAAHCSLFFFLTHKKKFPTRRKRERACRCKCTTTTPPPSPVHACMHACMPLPCPCHDYPCQDPLAVIHYHACRNPLFWYGSIPFFELLLPLPMGFHLSSFLFFCWAKWWLEKRTGV